MPTVIDSLIVALSLDPKGFTDGAKKVDQAQSKLQANAESSAKRVSAAGDTAAEFFGKQSVAALKFFAVLTAGKSLEGFARQQAQAAAGADRLATSLGISVQKLTTLENVTKRFGGSAGSVDSFLTSLQSRFTNQTTRGALVQDFLRNLQVDITDPKTGKLKDPQALFLELNKAAKVKGPDVFSTFMGTEGASRDLTESLQTDTALYQANMADAARTAITPEQGRAGMEFGTDIETLRQDIEADWNAFLAKLEPPFHKAALDLEGLLGGSGSSGTTFAAAIGGLAVAAGVLKAASLPLAAVKGLSALLGGSGGAAGGVALDGAATALTGSATALDEAAAALMGAAGKGGIGGPAAAGREAVKDGVESGLKEAAADAAVVGEDAAGAATGVGAGPAVLGTAALIGTTALLPHVLSWATGQGFNAQNPTFAGAQPNSANRGNTAAQRAQALSDATYLQSKGLTPLESAIVVGNLQQESGLNDAAYNKSSGAIGLGQWLGSRVTDFQRAMGTDFAHSTRQQQLDFVMWELKHTEHASMAVLAAAKDARTGAVAFGQSYERYGANEEGYRGSYAEDINEGIKNANTVHVSTTNHTSHEAHMHGDIHVHTQASDPHAVANSVGKMLVDPGAFANQSSVGLT